MVVQSEQKCGVPVHFELSIRNVEKPDLDRDEIVARLRQLAGHHVVVLTRALTFAEKADLFPGATVVVGADTIRRVADPLYYAGDERKMTAAIEQIADAGCRFLVFGRLLAGTFRGMADLPLPSALLDLCQGVDESQFRRDISSSDLRDRSTSDPRLD